MNSNVLEQKSKTQGAVAPLGTAADGDLTDLEILKKSNGVTTTKKPATARCRKLTGNFTREEIGDEPPKPVQVGEANEDPADHSEVASPGGESGQIGGSCVDATVEQLAAAESGEETAFSDLETIEGFEAPEIRTQESGEDEYLPDAGDTRQSGQAEFGPLLGAVMPTLISSVGPSVMKAAVDHLSPHAIKALRHAAKNAGGAIADFMRPANLRRVGRGVAGAANHVKNFLGGLFEAAELQESAESEVEVDPTIVALTVQAIESIIGSDDRVRITPTTSVPWRRICALRITFAGGTFRGTGFFVGPRTVITAGHCVYMHDRGGWARRIEVIPGADGTAQPYGQAVATNFRSVQGWVSGRKPACDYGCIILPAGSFGGRSPGNFAVGSLATSALLAKPVVLAGYPGDKPFAEMWGMARRLKTVTNDTLIYDLDTMGGQSGAPLYIKENGTRYVVGIHNYGAATGNSATRINETVYANLLKWQNV